MFKKLATVRPFWFVLQALEGAGASNSSHSNDNRPGFRHPAGRYVRPKPVLDCHWIEVGGRLECRWTVAGNDAPQNDAEPRLFGSFLSIRRTRSAA